MAGVPGGAQVRRGRPRTVELEEVILLACFEIMSEVGYARMSVDEVARRTGMTRPTVYRRWPPKESLAVAALERSGSGIVEVRQARTVRAATGTRD